MKITHLMVGLILTALLSACGPKSITTDTENLNPASEAWITYEGHEELTYVFDTLRMVFTGSEKENYYENVRYMTDQGGFVELQKDYYADLERQKLMFNSISTPYFIQYYLERNKGELGDWDILKVSVGDGDYYQNEMKIVTYETESSNKGENFTFKKEMVLNGVTYENVYFKKQERRPFEIYYTINQGIVGFKVSSTELWTLRQDNIK